MNLALDKLVKVDNMGSSLSLLHDLTPAMLRACWGVGSLAEQVGVVKPERAHDWSKRKSGTSVLIFQFVRSRALFFIARWT